MNDCAKEKDYIGYINLVERLENMSILALSGDEADNIRNIRRLQRAYIENLNFAKNKLLESEAILRQDLQRDASAKQYQIRQYYIEYPLARIIERICVHSLKRTVLKTQIPSGGTAYKIDKDIAATIEDLNYYLENYGVDIPEEAQQWIKE